jgi:hypothetical protein
MGLGEVREAEPLVPECSYFVVEINIGKLEICKSQDIGLLPADLIQKIRILLKSVRKNKELS